MIVRETTDSISKTTNSRDVAGAKAVNEMVSNIGENITLKPNTKVNDSGTLKNLSTYINGLTENYVGKYVKDNTIVADWIATETSAIDTPLTESVNVPAGLYLITVKTPYSTYTVRSLYKVFNISGDSNTVYGGENLFYTFINMGSTFILARFGTNQTGLCLASASSNTEEWDSQYLTRGCLTFVRLGD